MSIAFNIVLEQPLIVFALVIALIGLKMVVLFVLATFFRMHVAERLLLAVLLSQAGEFAFVVLQFARTAGNLSGPEVELLTVVVALSMAATPFLLFLFDRLWMPRLNAKAEPDAADLPPGPTSPIRTTGSSSSAMAASARSSPACCARTASR